MNTPVDDRYFEWLYSQIGAVSNRNPARSYWNVCRKLHSTEFVWLVANDDNRVEEGKELRHQFLSEQGSDGVDPMWMGLGCSVFEMLIALARRACDLTYSADNEILPGEWFRTFLKNLGFDKATDDKFTAVTERRLETVLDRFIYRNYRDNGRGGLFPLKKPDTDQTKVELWYQLNAYVIENSMV